MTVLLHSAVFLILYMLFCIFSMESVSMHDRHCTNTAAALYSGCGLRRIIRRKSDCLIRNRFYLAHMLHNPNTCFGDSSGADDVESASYSKLPYFLTASSMVTAPVPTSNAAILT